MTASSRNGLLLAGIGVLLLVGVVGAAVHDDSDGGSRPPDDGGSFAADTTSPTVPAAPATPTIVPPAPITPTSAVRVPGPATTVVPAPSTSAAPTIGGNQSGLGATGNGSVATGAEPLANTGGDPSTVPALVLLALAAGSRGLSRRTGASPG